jgi:hypothetical protein
MCLAAAGGGDVGVLEPQRHPGTDLDDTPGHWRPARAVRDHQ